MLKTVMVIIFIITAIMALTFACACVVGSRDEKRGVETPPPQNKTSV